MRLIDADALKKYVKSVEDYESAYTINGIIDEAPTIIWCGETPDGLPLMDLRPRPKGEWIFGSTLGHGWMKCSNCCVSQSGQTLCWSFCPNCGADMRPKPNQLRDCENCVHHSKNGCEVWECEFEKRSDV